MCSWLTTIESWSSCWRSVAEGGPESSRRARWHLGDPPVRRMQSRSCPTGHQPGGRVVPTSELLKQVWGYQDPAAPMWCVSPCIVFGASWRLEPGQTMPIAHHRWGGGIAQRAGGADARLAYDASSPGLRSEMAVASGRPSPRGGHKMRIIAAEVAITPQNHQEVNPCPSSGH